MDIDDILNEEGHWCRKDGCTGIMEWRRRFGESCSCHINPPCSACMEMKLTCTKCGYVLEDDPDDEECKDNILTRHMEL